MSELVLYFKLFKNTKISRVQNEYVDNYTGIFYVAIFTLFCITVKETTEKIEKRAK